MVWSERDRTVPTSSTSESASCWPIFQQHGDSQTSSDAQYREVIAALLTSSVLTISQVSAPADGRACGQLALLRTPVGRQPLSVRAFSSLEQAIEVEAIGRVRLTGSVVRFDALRAENAERAQRVVPSLPRPPRPANNL